MLWLEKTVVFSTSGCATTQKSNTKMKEKQLYEAPWAQTFVVQAEGMIGQSTLEMLAMDPTQGFDESAIIVDADSALWW